MERYLYHLTLISLGDKLNKKVIYLSVFLVLTLFVISACSQKISKRILENDDYYNYNGIDIGSSNNFDFNQKDCKKFVSRDGQINYIACFINDTNGNPLLALKWDKYSCGTSRVPPGADPNYCSDGVSVTLRTDYDPYKLSSHENYKYKSDNKIVLIKNLMINEEWSRHYSGGRLPKTVFDSIQKKNLLDYDCIELTVYQCYLGYLNGNEGITGCVNLPEPGIEGTISLCKLSQD